MLLVDKESGIKLNLNKESITTLNDVYSTEYEVGGLLFTNELFTDTITLNFVSIPNWRDTKTNSSFLNDSKKLNRLIKRKFKEKLYYIGDWHSHTNNVSTLSDKDINTIQAIYLKSKHNLKYMFHLLVSKEKEEECTISAFFN